MYLNVSGYRSGAKPVILNRTGNRFLKEILVSAYKLLGVTENESDADIKRCYRKQMNQHHPDKLVSKGLPEEMIDIATQKTQDIKNAYELIRSHRK